MDGVHDEGPVYAFRWNIAAHSAYWDLGNPSLKSMGMIVAGDGQQPR